VKPVVSASRRIDMVATCPDRLLAILGERHSPDRVHTLVIWTKAPGLLLSNTALRARVRQYPSVFVHVTVTGMGGSFVEPGAPPMEESLEALGEVVVLASGPDHVAVRFDPVCHLRLPDGSDYTNLGHFETVATAAAGLGIRRIIVSWMQVYRKVERRLRAAGIDARTPGSEGRASDAGHLQRVADRLGLALQGCCVPGWPTGACIDGTLFGRIHPAGERCSLAQAQGQRDLCGCTRSVDIGWYGPCVHGCLYCYANPRSATQPTGERASPR
jgi:DNA repair photolyase